MLCSEFSGRNKSWGRFEAVIIVRLTNLGWTTYNYTTVHTAWRWPLSRVIIVITHQTRCPPWADCPAAGPPPRPRTSRCCWSAGRCRVCGGGGCIVWRRSPGAAGLSPAVCGVRAGVAATWASCPADCCCYCCWSCCDAVVAGATDGSPLISWGQLRRALARPRWSRSLPQWCRLNTTTRHALHGYTATRCDTDTDRAACGPPRFWVNEGPTAAAAASPRVGEGEGPTNQNPRADKYAHLIKRDWINAIYFPSYFLPSYLAFAGAFFSDGINL